MTFSLFKIALFLSFPSTFILLIESSLPPDMAVYPPNAMHCFFPTPVL